MRASVFHSAAALFFAVLFSATPVLAANDKACIETINGIITFYAPGAGGEIQGGFETSRPNLAGRNIPMTLDDVRLGNSRYVTLAANEAHYGKYYYMGSVSYQSPIDGRWYRLNDVMGYVHDTGGAFRSQGCARWNTCSQIGRKFDVAVGNFTGLSGTSAGKFVGAMPDGQKASRAMCQTDGPITAPPTSEYLFQGQRPEFLPDSTGPSASGGLGSSLLRVLGIGGAQPTPQQGIYASPSQGAYPSPDPVSGGSGAPPAPGGGTAVTTPGPSVATLIVQAANVRRGSYIQTAWSSLNMSSNPQCSVTVTFPDGSQRALQSANNGAESLLVPLTMSLGSSEVQLRCTPLKGTVIEKMVSVSIE
jgi:hypothetical protein